MTDRPPPTMPSPPRGTVAFLFTDIEGSTRLWQTHAGAMPAADARHDAILRAAVTAAGGLVYKVVGDAYQAAFPTAPDAVRAALAAQLAFQAEPWPDVGLPEPLRVRMALHAGAVDPDAHGDYRSPVLNRAGRLLDVGHGGQTLLSLAAAELARDALPAPSSLRDLGERQLKDLYRPERVYQLIHPDLPHDFAPLRTLDRRPHNLPAQATPLIGREAEIAAVRHLLEHDGVRLATLTGPGGVGKTRLGLQVAAELVDTFQDGVFFVPLAHVTDPALVVPAIAGALGVREEGGDPLAATLAAFLGDRSLLLVVDNVEQVLEGAGAVAELLASSPGLRVLATSRARLQIQGEHERPVQPLGLPDPNRLPTVDKLSQYDAVRLFVQRAVAAKPDFAVTNRNAPAVAEICVRLDGLPLAIELAAARIKLLPPDAMLGRLDRLLPLLTGGARDMLAHQRTLHDTIAWSYDLLAPAERILFRRLSVFAGGCTLEAAEAIAALDDKAPGHVVLDGLSRLVDQSLLRQTEDPGGAPRYRMLETIREFGLAQLTAHGDEETLARGVAFFVELAERASIDLMSGRFGDWIARLESEAGNVTATLAWAFASSDPSWALRLTGSLWLYWERHGPILAARSWLEQALARSDGIDDRLRLGALLGMGALSAQMGDRRLAEPALEHSLMIARRLNDHAAIGLSLNNLAILAAEEQPASRELAIELFNEAIQVFQHADLSVWEAHMLNNLGVAYLSFGEPEAAVPLVALSIEKARQIGDEHLTAAFHSILGNVWFDLGDLEAALTSLRHALEVVWRTGDLSSTVDALEGLARVASTVPMAETATRLFGFAESVRRAHGVAMTRHDRALHDRAVADVRASLGDAAFEVAWAAGRAMPLDEAVAEALGEPFDA